jgi:RNA polymerase sigma factor (sigma-70 family)
VNARLRALLQPDPLRDPAPLVRRVYAYVAYRIGDGPDAEDVTNETFVRALRYRDTFDASKGTPISWLIGIARRCVDESFHQIRPASDDPPDREAAGDLAADTVERLTMQAAVSRLDERDRELIALRYGADLSARQIAQRLEMSPNAVDVALHRARTRLREELEGRPSEESVRAPSTDRRVRNPGPPPVSTARRPSDGETHR